MIQRIQSLFLFAASVFATILLFYPISRMQCLDPDILPDYLWPNFYSTSVQYPNTGQVYMTTFPIAILAVLTGVLSLISIFLYKNRVLQIRLTVYNVVLTLGLAILIFFYYFKIQNISFGEGVELINHHFTFAIILPFVNIILLFLSFMAIRRDDLLIKSYDRLR